MNTQRVRDRGVDEGRETESMTQKGENTESRYRRGNREAKTEEKRE